MASSPKKPRLVRHHVKQWRKQRKLTQEQVAGRIDRSRGLVSQIETGETDLTEEMIYALAAAFNIEAGDLLSIDPTKEGEVVDFMARLRKATPEQRRQVIAVAEALLRTGAGG